MIQQSHCWAYTLRKPEGKETRVPQCSSQHCFNSQDMEATQMSISRWMDKKAVVHIHNGCLENPRDGGAWWAPVSGVAQSQTQLKRLSSSSSKESDMTERLNWAELAFIIDKDEPSWIEIYYFVFPCSKKEMKTHSLIVLGCSKGKHSSPWLGCDKQLIVCISSEPPRQEHDNVWHFSIIYWKHLINLAQFESLICTFTINSVERRTRR